MWVFGAVFLLQGLANSAYGIGRVAYLFDIAPARERPTYYGLANTILGPLHFLPALGGALLDRVGFASLFAVALGMIVLAYGVSVRLGDLGTRQDEAAAGSLGEQRQCT
jgi:MFS family permease